MGALKRETMPRRCSFGLAFYFYPILTRSFHSRRTTQWELLFASESPCLTKRPWVTPHVSLPL